MRTTCNPNIGKELDLRHCNEQIIIVSYARIGIDYRFTIIIIYVLGMSYQAICAFCVTSVTRDIMENK